MTAARAAAGAARAGRVKRGRCVQRRKPIGMIRKHAVAAGEGGEADEDAGDRGPAQAFGVSVLQGGPDGGQHQWDEQRFGEQRGADQHQRWVDRGDPGGYESDAWPPESGGDQPGQQDGERSEDCLEYASGVPAGVFGSGSDQLVDAGQRHREQRRVKGGGPDVQGLLGDGDERAGPGQRHRVAVVGGRVLQRGEVRRGEHDDQAEHQGHRHQTEQPGSVGARPVRFRAHRGSKLPSIVATPPMLVP